MKKHSSHLLHDLQSCKQTPSETVTQYGLRIEACLTRLQADIQFSCEDKVQLPGRIGAMEDLALNTFLLGLSPNLSTIVRCRNPLTLNDAITQAVEEEKLFKLTRVSPYGPKPIKTCSICHKNGHSSSDCYVKKRDSNFKNLSLYSLQHHLPVKIMHNFLKPLFVPTVKNTVITSIIVVRDNITINAVRNQTIRNRRLKLQKKGVSICATYRMRVSREKALEFISKAKEASKQNYDASALRLLCHHGSTESEILPVIHSPGLYFDPTTNIFFYNDFWKIVTHVDVNSIEPHLNEIDKLIVKSSLLCSKIEPEEYSNCRDIFNSIEVLLETNYVKAHSLSHIISKDTANRFKRALEFGGEILKFFFGTLDAEDARNYDAAIDACEKNDNEIFRLMKDNIHIVGCTGVVSMLSPVLVPALKALCKAIGPGFCSRV
ncbi:hypothetical protein HW555_006482 [Spodoptera exigua]|uniref:Uncharacterized protein n=1 Tax=Spodoptera exigua TaxID=7107 RepID=A0A835GEJ5_SPOEX|nr:hypothetical protein HW555_006482 [Spodoptera exigua]